MAQTILVDASPEKRLFISLITRDISLVAAFLDLIDNAINSAVEPFSDKLTTAADYLAVANDPNIKSDVTIDIQFDKNKVTIKDTAGGISAKTAENHVFKFGRSPGEDHEDDRLSVYGIGLKRALFKLGARIQMQSDHPEGGFNLDLNVPSWEKDPTQPWKFPITTRDPAAGGTTITVTRLHDEVKRRLCDGVFLNQLSEAIAKTYAFYVPKFARITVQGKEIDPVSVDIGSNHTTEIFVDGPVSCAVTAGIGIPQGGSFRDRSSGWFVFCNGRAVVSADKSPLTGWGGGGLPIFQPKHRPFVGTVFIVSRDPERLPWNTTKSGINEDSSVWQMARQQMTAVARLVISFLDGRYTDEGTEVASKDLQEAAGERTSVIAAAVAEKRVFTPPSKPKAEIMRIQYDARIADVRRIAEYLRKPSMSGSDVGRHTFQYFLRNEVGEA